MTFVFKRKHIASVRAHARQTKTKLLMGVHQSFVINVRSNRDILIKWLTAEPSRNVHCVKSSKLEYRRCPSIRRPRAFPRRSVRVSRWTRCVNRFRSKASRAISLAKNSDRSDGRKKKTLRHATQALEKYEQTGA